MTSRLLQVKEVAELLGMSHSTVLRYAKAGEFKAFRISSNALRIEEASFERWLQSRCIGDTQALVPVPEEGS